MRLSRPLFVALYVPAALIYSTGVYRGCGVGLDIAAGMLLPDLGTSPVARVIGGLVGLASPIVILVVSYRRSRAVGSFSILGFAVAALVITWIRSIAFGALDLLGLKTPVGFVAPRWEAHYGMWVELLDVYGPIVCHAICVTLAVTKTEARALSPNNALEQTRGP
jgi:hypothetical protein